MEKYITVKGARTHNLKNIDVQIPRGKITALVGVSGAGKSSLAFHTIYAEGYLRYIESISPYFRQLLDKMDIPPVDDIDSLPPSISFKHKKPVKNPRSIVATSLDIFDYLRILYAKISEFFCPGCGAGIRRWSIDEIVTELLERKPGKVDICFDYRGDVAFLVNRGYYFHLHDGKRERIAGSVKDKTIFVLIDSVEVEESNKGRLFEALDRSISLGKDAALVFTGEGKKTFPTDLYCPRCDVHHQPPDEHLFSFNSPKGACPDCKGFGDIQQLDRNLIFDPSKSLAGGAVRPFNTPATRYYRERLLVEASMWGMDLHLPVAELTPMELDRLLWGDGDYEGIAGYFETLKKKSYKVQARVLLSRYVSYEKCPLCKGGRFNDTALAYKIEGKHISEFLSMNAGQALHFLRSLDEDDYSDKISADVFSDIEARLKYLVESGLAYIGLDRPAFTLSRGEMQRINLAFILGSTLSDSLLIIDQPSADLHPGHYDKLGSFLRNLRANGNTVLLIEHNPGVVKFADHVLELGPLSGTAGGQIVFSGDRASFFKGEDTLTQKHFSNPPRLKANPRLPGKEGDAGWLNFTGASTHNLKDFDFRVPVNAFTVITGVSGAGKTTLLYHEIFLKNRHHRGRGQWGGRAVKEIVFIDPGMDRVRSGTIAAGFFDIWKGIRELFAAGKESKILGYTPGHFSFNSALGRCEHCKGKGFNEIEMQFLPAVNIPCGDCRGSGYKPEILKIKFLEKNIHDIMGLTFNDFLDLAGDDLPARDNALLTGIRENGLGYIQVGQRLKTLSAGELQRMKLLKFLNTGKKNTLFLVDEPSFGLHPFDIEKVKSMIDRIVDKGNTVVAAEHQAGLVAHADYILELGPEGGEKGGFLTAEGTPAVILANPGSTTGLTLKKNIKNT